MIPEVKFEFTTGVERFDSLQNLRSYLKQLLDAYQREFDKVNSLTGELLRNEDMESDKARSKGWFEAGNMFVNKSDPARAGLDIMLQVIKEAKPKIASLEESLKAFEQFENLQISEDAIFLLYLREGVPERIIVGPSSQESPDLGPAKVP